MMIKVLLLKLELQFYDLNTIIDKIQLSYKKYSSESIYFAVGLYLGFSFNILFNKAKAF